MGILDKFKKKPVSQSDKPNPPAKPQANNQIKHIIAIGSGKGGVGKSTVTHQLAHALKHQGYKVGTLDADVYGPSQATLFNYKTLAQVENGLIIPVERDGLKFISMNTVSNQQGALVVRSPIATRAIMQFLTGVNWGELDYLLIDLPPGTGDIQLSVAQKAKLSGAIIVTTPQPLAAEIAAKSVSMFQKVNVPVIGIIENMSGYNCSHCHQHNDIFSRDGGSLLAKQAKTSLLAQIPLTAELIQTEQSNSSSVEPGFILAANAVTNWIKKHAGTTDCEPDKITLSDDRSDISFTWPDKTEKTISAYTLRTACACAACKDEFSGEPLLEINKIAKDIKILNAKAVGRYGLAVRFSDGHSTGIYRYETLKQD